MSFQEKFRNAFFVS